MNLFVRCLLVIALVAVAVLVIVASADSGWTRMENNDGSYSLLKMVNGEVDEEIGYTADGRKSFHKRQDSALRTIVIRFDAETGEETECEIME